MTSHQSITFKSFVYCLCVLIVYCYGILFCLIISSGLLLEYSKYGGAHVKPICKPIGDLRCGNLLLSERRSEARAASPMEAVLRETRDPKSAAVARRPIAPQQRGFDARVHVPNADRLARTRRQQRAARRLHADALKLRSPRFAYLVSQLVLVGLPAPSHKRAIRAKRAQRETGALPHLLATLRVSALEAGDVSARNATCVCGVRRNAVIAAATAGDPNSFADHRSGRCLLRRPPAIHLRSNVPTPSTSAK